jgi:hypothetical protein
MIACLEAQALMGAAGLTEEQIIQGITAAATKRMGT